MSMHWVEGRIPRPPVEDVIRSAVGIETEGYTHQAVFNYPRTGGIEAMVKAISKPVERRINTDFNITRIKAKKNEYIISDGETNITVDTCISTIPLQELLKCLDNVPKGVRKACADLKYNSIACIFLGIKGKVPEISWLYVPDKNLGLFNRVSFPSNYSPEVAPPGHSSILVEVTYREGDEASLMPEKDLIDHTVEALKNMKIISNIEDVVYSKIERQKYAYVIYDLDYLRNIEIVKDFCAKIGIGLVGRFAEFEYLNMDGCIRNAMEFVRKECE
jgi:protoporphyrinogen oxidase